MNQELLFSLLVDLHLGGERQGPGSEEATLRALAQASSDPSSRLKIADIGCGTGASSLVLARSLPNAEIIAVDLFPEFIAELEKRAGQYGLSGNIKTLEASMDSLPFSENSLDVIWSEGAIYNIGFKKGIELWRPLLKKGGILAVSEITWLHPDPPEEIRQHWETEYPEIATSPDKIKQLEDAGYDLLGYSVLPPSDWQENYYIPTQSRLPEFAARHPGVQEVQDLIAMETNEANLYEKFKDWFSYGFYVVAKR
ncbi:class I SAM-dependent methyltransferase [Alteromonas sp. KUL49]|uniref:class I SAM-dependent methyltransferase n=1 Tax=Alteromonas sp. KUL49 TaxID=2480798 RepID=UPI00102EFC67|nr:class I SAM-dependent methyltransferase [Alteromonas sp. KUL49]TAP41282.1 class I SAM-dependent methyltransferase [Alteromonas sp. KUL49]GEA10340.1 methyltransferase type 11 [Alteromonas sp. KUL49]